MSNVLDDNLIQKYLFINADRIYNKIIEGGVSLSPDKDMQTKLLSKSTLGKKHDRKSASLLISRQHELLSANLAPTEQSALELFRDPKTENFFINNGYAISHNLIFSRNKQKYIANIDTINTAVNENVDGFGGRFVFHKLDIVNRSKDAFTTKANFQVTLHIAFNFFEDLKEEIITGINLNNPSSSVERFSVLQLLYPFFNKNAPSDVSNAAKSLKGGNGIILNQVLDMTPGYNTYFKNTVSALNSSKQIHKNYHLTYYKHSINIFKSNEATLKPFDSELVIDFVAYEADDRVNNAKDDNIPTISSNMYSLLTKEPPNSIVGLEVGKLATNKKYQDAKSAFVLFNSIVKDLNKQIQNLEFVVSCYKNEKQDITNKVDVGIKPTDPKFEETAKKRISELRDQINKITQEFSTNLFKAIINKLDLYSFRINAGNLIEYQDATRWESALKTLSGGFGATATVASLATTTGLATGGTSLIVGGVALAGAAVYSAATAEGNVFGKGVATLRDEFNRSITINKIGSKGQDKYASLVLNAIKNNQVNNSPFLFDQRQQIIDKQPEEIKLEKTVQLYTDEETKKKIFELNEDKFKIESSEQDLDINFILFGQLVDLIPKTDDTNIVIGGKTIPNDSELNCTYLNYYYVPIHYEKFLKFLKQKILDRSDFNYNSEVFLREITETFLKETILKDGVISDVLKDLVPTSVSMNVHLVDGTSTACNDFLNNAEGDLLDNANFTKIKKAFVLSKNLTPNKSTKQLKKIYTITADEDIKYYNFYNAYSEWFKVNKPRGSPNTSAEFQEFIVSTYGIPCLRTKTVDTYGSILIGKNLTFTRKDNPNFTTGQLLDNSSQLRLPYVVNGKYKPYIYFFCDVASFMFIAPPDKRNGIFDTSDTFGYGGLYLVKNSSFEYHFQLLDSNNAPIFPNEKSKCELVGQLITYGDGVVPGLDKDKTGATKTLAQRCSDPQSVSDEPAEIDQE